MFQKSTSKEIPELQKAVASLTKMGKQHVRRIKDFSIFKALVGTYACPYACRNKRDDKANLQVYFTF